MKGYTTFNDVLAVDLKNPRFKKKFEEELIRERIALQIARLREKKHFTQVELAKRLHVSQQAVAKLEQPDSNVTISTLQKIATVFGKKLEIKFV